MTVVTKTGDQGMTSLIGGKRVPKNDSRVEAYGTVDELSAFIGVLHDVLPEAEIEVRSFLMVIQKHLLTVEAVLACPEEDKVAGLETSAIKMVEDWITDLEKQLPPLSSFVLPGGNLAASYCHVCRTICRRAERCVVGIGKVSYEMVYLNRLSDFFFELARSLSI